MEYVIFGKGFLYIVCIGCMMYQIVCYTFFHYKTRNEMIILFF